MTRKEVRLFLKAGADAISIFFESGRITEFNSLRDKKFPFAWLESLKTGSDFGESSSMLIDEWEVNIHVAKIDSMDSSPDEYESIVDECDDIARKLIWQYNLILYGSSAVTTANKDLYKLVTMSGMARDPFIKKHADPVTSGVILSFSLKSPDKTNVCP